MRLTPTSTSEAARRARVTEARKPSLAAFARDDRGAQLVEYIIVVGMVALIAMAGFKTFGFTLRAKIDQQEATVYEVPGQ